MDIKYIDFKKYYNLEDIKDYELYIGPNGEYYKVKTRYESDQDCTHYEWAEKYFIVNNLTDLKENIFIKHKCKTALEILINYFGFIGYTHCYYQTFIDLPNHLYFGYIITNEQKESLYNLINYNNDKVNDEILDALDYREKEYDLKRDHFFQKNLNMRR